MKIDVCDTKQIWCEAKVISAITGISTKILIHYEGWASRYDELIDIPSQRIAPHKTMTSRTEIPHYVLNNSGECNFAYVVTGNEQPPRDFPIDLFSGLILRNLRIISDNDHNNT